MDATNSGLMQLIRRIRFAEQVVSPSDGETSSTLEYQNLTTGGWTVSCDDGALVLKEKLGSDEKVLAPGIEKVEFKRDGFLIKVTFTFGSGEDARQYSTILYTRGARRPPGS